MSKYNGHKNWPRWNVSLWINNDEGLYRCAQDCVRYTRTRQAAAQVMLEILHAHGKTETPDGARYTISSIRAAMVDL